MKRPLDNPSLPRAILAERIKKVRQSESKALQALIDRRTALLKQVRCESDPSARKQLMSKVADLDDAIRLRNRELRQLYPDRIKAIVRAQSVTPRSSRDSEALAKITWAKPYRG